VAGLDADGVDAIAAAKTADGEAVADMVTNLIATIGENMLVRRSARFQVAQGAIGAYVHNAIAPDLGRMGVLVALEGAADQAALQDLGRKIAMHVAATNPLSLSVEDLDPAAVDKERAIFTEQAIASGKPPQVAEKMVEGRLRKFYEEVTLLKQAFVMDSDLTIEQLVEKTGKELGAPIKVKGFVRLALGEGVAKKSEDFAAEVAAVSGQA
jgi:elongation factor Ts